MQPYFFSEEQVKRLITETGNRVFNANFGSRTHITGDELINFSPIHQVNRFILFQIYQEWNLHMNKMTHPYFNFRDREVQEALSCFQNILSKHIRIEKLEFKLLLDKAVYNNFRLIINPIELFKTFFFLPKDSTSKTTIEKYSNYFFDFDFIITSFLSYCQTKNIENISLNIFLEKVEKITEVYEQRVGHSIENYRGILFHKLTGYEIGPFLRDQRNQNSGIQDHRLLNRIETINNVINYPVNEFPKEQIVEKTLENHSLNTGYSNQAEGRTENNLIPNQINQINQINIESQGETRRLADVLSGTGNSTIADNIAKSTQNKNQNTFFENRNQEDTNHPITNTNNSEQEQSARLVDRFKNQDVKPSSYAASDQNVHNRNLNVETYPEKKELHNSVKMNFMLTIEQIPVYKQFSFIQRVFGGSKDRFNMAINAINNCENYDQAKNYMDTHILNLPDNSGRLNEPEIVDFMELVRNNFS